MYFNRGLTLRVVEIRLKLEFIIRVVHLKEGKYSGVNKIEWLCSDGWVGQAFVVYGFQMSM